MRSEAERLLADGALRLNSNAQSGATGRTDHVATLSSAELRERGCPALARGAGLLAGAAEALRGQVPDVGGAEGATVPLCVPERAMLACYMKGDYYAAHRDTQVLCPPGRGSHGPDASRRLTLILYLGAETRWSAADGGALRVHTSAACDNGLGCKGSCTGTDCHLDILPEAGRCVAFNSQCVLHEVRPSRRKRFALTLWVWDARRKQVHDFACSLRKDPGLLSAIRNHLGLTGNPPGSDDAGERARYRIAAWFLGHASLLELPAALRPPELDEQAVAAKGGHKKPAEASYSIVGSWDGWAKKHQMTWHGGRWNFRVELGDEGQESFQILQDGHWNHRLHPDVKGANPHLPHALQGPDKHGGGLNWTIGSHRQDGAVPGMEFDVWLLVDDDGQPLRVDWEVACPTLSAMGHTMW